MHNRYILYYYYSSSTKCSTVVQVPWLPEVIEGHEGHVTLKEWKGCACATGSCAISALVGPFHWKWRHQTSPEGDSLGSCGISIQTSPRSDRRTPEGGGRGVHMRNRKLHNIRPSGAFWSEMTSPVGLPLENMEALRCSLWRLGHPRGSLLGSRDLRSLPVAMLLVPLYYILYYHLLVSIKRTGAYSAPHFLPKNLVKILVPIYKTQEDLVKHAR